MSNHFILRVIYMTHRLTLSSYRSHSIRLYLNRLVSRLCLHPFLIEGIVPDDEHDDSVEDQPQRTKEEQVAEPKIVVDFFGKFLQVMRHINPHNALYEVNQSRISEDEEADQSTLGVNTSSTLVVTDGHPDSN